LTLKKICLHPLLRHPLMFPALRYNPAITAPFKPDADPLSVVTAVPVAITVTAAKQMEALAAQAARAALTFPYNSTVALPSGLLPNGVLCS
jgi:hypothetical protein